MPLAAGSRLGPYEIVAPIGAGGMGEVYRARDTKLGREVAVKILPEAFAQDADRLARFEREARLLASLNHPHIATLYGMEHDGGRHFLVMELVEGPTVADKLAEVSTFKAEGSSLKAQGPGRGLPVNEALDIAGQIAEALEAAHEQGVVHRDLKPANIKVRPDGTVKVLDFGLAKLQATASGEPGSAGRLDLSASPTITTPAMTAIGMILGTAAYMSPEQARGRLVDRRTDVWAFGCVLFEMLTGIRAFEGEDVAETVGAIIHKEPDWTKLPATTPSSVRLALQRCLEKDPKRRMRDIGDVQLALGGAFDVPAPASTGIAAPREPAWKRATALAATAAVAAIVVGGAAWTLRPVPRAAIVARFALTPPEGEVLSGLGRPMLALSPDGTELAYVANDRIYVRSLSEFEAHPITGQLGGVTSLVFSPDGRSIGFYTNRDQTLQRISVTGGTPVTICPIAPGASAGPYGISWDASGIVFGGLERGIFRCVSDGSQPEKLVASGSGEFLYGPQWLPGGDGLLFSVSKASDGLTRWDKGQIVVQTKSGARKTVANGRDARYLPTGHLLYAQGGVMYAAPFDPSRQILTGEPVAVVEGVRRGTGPAALGSATAQLSVSSTGTLAYLPGPARTAATTDVGLALADRAGMVTRLVGVPPGPYEHVRASRDGTHIAIASDDGKEAIISIYDLAGNSPPRRLTFEGRYRYPIWSPDGERVAFQSDREGDLAIFWTRADGNGPTERLTKPEKGEAHLPESWSPDGKFITFSTLKDSTYTLWTLSVADKKAAAFGNVQSSDPIGSGFSPDGRWVAYASTPLAAGATSPDRGIHVQPFPPTNAKFQIQHPSGELDFQPVWAAKGMELFYVPTAASGLLAAVTVTTSPSVTFGPPTTFPARVTGLRTSGLPRAYDVLPDGRFVGPVPTSNDESGADASSQIRIVVNWFEELKQKVPVK